MGYRYYAHVTFPTAADQIPAVYEAIRNLEAWWDLDHATDFTTISGGECSYGEIDITGVLQEHRVPYDHYHSDDCSGDPAPSTVYVRYDADGNAVWTEVFDSAQAEADLAEGLLKMLLEQDLAGLRIRLEELVAQGAKERIDDLVPGWAPEVA